MKWPRLTVDNTQLPGLESKTAATMAHSQLIKYNTWTFLIMYCIGPMGLERQGPLSILKVGRGCTTNCQRSELFLNPLNGTDASALKRITIVSF